MMAVAAIAAVIVNVLVERIAYRPLRNAPRLVPLISAIGASFFLQYTMRGLFGDGVYNYPTIDAFEQKVDIFGLGFLALKWLDVLVISLGGRDDAGAVPVRAADQGGDRRSAPFRRTRRPPR